MDNRPGRLNLTFSDVAAQLVSILVGAIGLIVFRLIDKYLPHEPKPATHPIATPNTSTERDTHGE